MTSFILTMLGMVCFYIGFKAFGALLDRANHQAAPFCAIAGVLFYMLSALFFAWAGGLIP